MSDESSGHEGSASDGAHAAVASDMRGREPTAAVLDSRAGKLGRLVSNPVFWLVVVAAMMLVPLASGVLRTTPKAPAHYGQLPDF
ncbi:MAG TPA: hypothetical protein ENK23_00055, partial [Sorangium sp.]|nr:hypothetical protein [Sorangium sp.]